ncbi:hypothetical protein D3C80_1318000 [compost metagenome]
MGHVAQAEGDGHAIEMVVRKGQFFRVGLDELDIAGHAQVQQAITPDLEHRGIDVSQDNLAGRADQVREFAGQVARAASNVEHAIACANAGKLDGEAFPEAVHATGQHVVHQVVLGRHRVKDFSDLLCLLTFRHVFVAEMGGGFGIAAFALIIHIAVTGKNYRPF